MIQANMPAGFVSKLQHACGAVADKDLRAHFEGMSADHFKACAVRVWKRYVANESKARG